MIAYVQVTGGTMGWGRGWVATDHEIDAEHGVRVRYDALGERQIDVHAHDGEDESKWEPDVGEKGIDWVRAVD